MTPNGPRPPAAGQRLAAGRATGIWFYSAVVANAALLLEENHFCIAARKQAVGHGAQGPSLPGSSALPCLQDC
jgi:hypothetical protein